MPRPTTTPAGQQFSPPTKPSPVHSAATRFGEAAVQVDRAGADVVVGVSTSAERRILQFAASVVTGWCADGALLLGAPLHVDDGDELEIRTPMLVARDGQCLALVRRIRGAGSSLRLLVATSAEPGATSWSPPAVSLDAGHTFVQLLRAVAA